ncbi:MAG: nicotinate-nucleotide adenylyltransferase [Acidobacteria bacterium]|nr:nicotinate-nucleotide adenylyltransferase [Acidobacteriota bacterium]
MKLAIFGGTFDPIHDAHLAIAREAVRRWELERVLFIPAGRPPHKAGFTHAPYEDRYRMVELACAAEPRFEPSRLEAGARFSYSIETIEKVRATMGPGDELYFIIGADAFAEIRTWRRWREVIDAVRFIVVSRPGHCCECPAGAEVLRLDDLDLSVSSSEIRRRLVAGDERVAVPSAVLGYIREHGLYRGCGACGP